MSERDIDVVSAGHLCLDLIPAFTTQERMEHVGDILIPGKMINMGKCVIAGGGPVTNAGVSIKRLGTRTEFIGKMGDDEFGKLVLDWYEKYEGHFEGITAALHQWEQDRPPRAVIEICDSRLYSEQVAIRFQEENQHLHLRAASGARPVLRQLGAPASLPDAVFLSSLRRSPRLPCDFRTAAAAVSGVSRA